MMSFCIIRKRFFRNSARTVQDALYKTGFLMQHCIRNYAMLHQYPAVSQSSSLFSSQRQPVFLHFPRYSRLINMQDICHSPC